MSRTKPIYIIYNIAGSYYKNFGLQKYQNSLSTITNYFAAQPENPNKQPINFTPKLLPVLNYGQSSIELRSKVIYDNLCQALAQNSSTENPDIIAVGLSGLDLRFALSEHPTLQTQVGNIITMGTPHKGSALCGLYNTGSINIDTVSRVSDVLGVRPESLKEINPQNIQNLNQYLEDWDTPGLNLYSVGGYKNIRGITDILMGSAKTLVDNRAGIFGNNDNDGVFYMDEVRFETFDKNEESDEDFVSYHIADIASDHVQLIGLAHEEHPVSGFG